MNVNRTDHIHILFFLYLMNPRTPRSTLFPYTTLFRSMGEIERGDKTLFVVGSIEYKDVLRCRRKTSFCWHYMRSEEHTSELQSRENLVCRLLLEKKKTILNTSYSHPNLTNTP